MTLISNKIKKKYIENPKNIKLIYNYWRFRIFYSMFFGYIFFYFTRKSLTFISPLIMDELYFSLSEFGIISTAFYITYALSKFISGIISDKSNPRYIMSSGLILTGALNICISYSSHINLILIFWILNAFFQGWGWPPITKQLTYWYNKQERGLWWGICSISQNIGGAIIPLIIGYLSIQFGWRKSMHIIGIICILIGILLINRLRNKPESLGLPPTEFTKTNNNKIIKKIIYNKNIWILSISYFLIYIIRTAINDWIILYLVNQKGYNLFLAGVSVFYFEIGGIIGIIIAGWITDKILKGNRMLFIFICSNGLVTIFTIFFNIPIGHKLIDYLIISILGFLTFGPQMLIGLIASEIVTKNAACTANGFVGCWAYIGAAITGYPLGIIINLSWNIYFFIIIICTIILIITITPILLNELKFKNILNK